RIFSQTRQALINDIKAVKAFADDGTAERNVTDEQLTDEALSDFGTELLIKELLPESALPTTKPRCELPRFRDALTADERQKVDEIWANYLKGPKDADCTKERRATQKYINNLPITNLAVYANLGDYFSPLGIIGR